ncbi:hypothetical protein CEXT_704931 [Caerostris extrusa]|uniref:Uncharacterized protein n=1 Tax=Caerostris extrusa TaxID=172846 RepID=A0AAV4Q9T9_CAEEX|nr:hypothetical protein CEXT_704931 [Caerostris extrusa]
MKPGFRQLASSNDESVEAASLSGTLFVECATGTLLPNKTRMCPIAPASFALNMYASVFTASYLFLCSYTCAPSSGTH